ncbi:SEC-C metal-binding domain-containing protein [Mesorhizobium sp. M0292]|uniref:SEC-C metal-binding domain-containing protein n=1 Tax=Mesorhizobium sp. M0292 TaxID=2956929 RepID=UPI00333C20FE
MNLPDDISPNDPCRCGSGRIYAECHGPIFSAAAGKMISVAQQRYVEEWSGNARAYEAQGLYNALAEQLAQRVTGGRVLDVGCGLGHGLSAMRDRLGLDMLVGIDENPECLALAAAKLGGDPLDSALRRMHSSELPNGQYRAQYDGKALRSGGALRLIQTDVLVNDPAFGRFLDEIGPLDAITLWFCGVHKARSATELAAFFKIRSDADHREVVEDAVTDLAQARLRRGGWMHIAIRAGFPDAQTAVRETRYSMAPMIDGKQFTVREIVPLSYREEPANGAIVVRSKNERINRFPSFAMSILIERTDYLTNDYASLSSSARTRSRVTT